MTERGIPEARAAPETDIFRCVKAHVTARQAAEKYGIAVGRNGMARCPFHADNIPSMKVDTRYHCFGCGADGDVINFVENLFRLLPIDAARKLAEDFNIEIPKWKQLSAAQKRSERRKEKKEQDIREVSQEYQETERRFFWAMTDYYHLLREWKEIHFPRSPDEDPDPRFVEAVQNITQIEYVLDCFLSANLPNRIHIMNEQWKKVELFERRVRESYAGAEKGTSGTAEEKQPAGEEKWRKVEEAGRRDGGGEADLVQRAQDHRDTIL